MTHIPSKTSYGLERNEAIRGNILRIAKRLRFINLPRQPFEAEKVPFDTIFSDLSESFLL